MTLSLAGCNLFCYLLPESEFLDPLMQQSFSPPCHAGRCWRGYLRSLWNPSSPISQTDVSPINPLYYVNTSSAYFVTNLLGLESSWQRVLQDILLHDMRPGIELAVSHFFLSLATLGVLNDSLHVCTPGTLSE